MRVYECVTCGHLYSEADGDPIHGIPPGTRWEELPDDWLCPDCGAAKAEFVLVET